MSTRRSLLGRVAGLSAIAALPTEGSSPPAMHPDAYVIAVAKRLEDAEMVIFHYDRELVVLTEDEFGEVCSRANEEGKRLIAMRPTTREGLIAKARAVRMTMQNLICTEPDKTFEELGEHPELMAWSLINDLLAWGAVA